MSSCPIDHDQPKESACPVDHTRSPAASSSSASTWSKLFGSGAAPASTSLSTDREISSIPKAAEGNWVYPSEAQFYAAMDRKNHNPKSNDMKTIVPIHNAVNERAWSEILKWEEGRGADKCGGLKLISFMGRPSEPSPKARWKSLLGYGAPFDRHDWIVDRCGTRTRYIIDFYTGKSHASSQAVSFYLDVRPALDNWEGMQMRVSRFFSAWLPNSTQSPSR